MSYNETHRDVENYLKQKYEGKLFVDYWFMPSVSADSFTFEEAFYIAQNGQIKLVEKSGSLSPTGDSFLCLTKMLCLGDYDLDSLPPSRTTKDFTLKELLTRLDFKHNCDLRKVIRL